MDAIEFVKQLRRMEGKGVPKNRYIYPCVGRETDPPEEVVAEVEQWSKEHPLKTRQSVFLEQYPEAELANDGAISICPIAVSAAYRDETGDCAVSGCQCADCRREFWMQEVE